MNAPHKPVLYKEIIHALQPKSPGRYVDGTLGAGGHARGILEACAPDGSLLGLDVDTQALALARENLAPYGQRAHLAQASYDSLLDAMRELGWDAVDGIVLDLGLSSMQLDTPERGFSFTHDAPLDMRFNRDSELTAAQLVNTLPEADLTDLLFKYGEEPRARRIVRNIIKARPLTTTAQLAEIVKQAYPEHSRVHPATRTFQALRIAVNDELATVENALPKTVSALRRGGRLAVISFHSLEDRIVKDFFRSESKDLVNPPYEQIYKVERRAMLKEINRKPIRPDQEEIKENPRARSAKLRVVEKL
ncbi:MAG: 16S rRNA (cytosine(1402)-N(4))-methyltransferase RsmH [Chloroflexi bacterium]|nr:16S rRNA (cytosine(1402)-N(4))-methyltransferase RsmH [Chloroflexota bacterium]MBI3341197.1 16S rRNA (cytosine(1402)-N(4))-methyltransferase RsmH [Chloroflexota bacterium]